MRKRRHGTASYVRVWRCADGVVESQSTNTIYIILYYIQLLCINNRLDCVQCLFGCLVVHLLRFDCYVVRTAYTLEVFCFPSRLFSSSSSLFYFCTKIAASPRLHPNQNLFRILTHTRIAQHYTTNIEKHNWKCWTTCNNNNNNENKKQCTMLLVLCAIGMELEGETNKNT